MGVRVRACVFAVFLMLSASAVRRTTDTDHDESDVPVVSPDAPETPKAQLVGDTKANDLEEFTASTERTEPVDSATPTQNKTAERVKRDRDYQYEIIVGIVFIVYVINYLIGRRSNQEIADRWGNAVLGDTKLCSLQKNFELIHPDNSLVPDATIMKDSCSSFQIYSTGRRHCWYMSSTLELLSRQDLFATLYNRFSGAAGFDTVKFEVGLASEAKCCLSVCSNPRKQQLDCKDLEAFAQVHKAKLPKGLSMLTECDEISTEFVKSCGAEVLKLMDQLKDGLEYIHISDQISPDPRYPYVMRCAWKLPPSSETMLDQVHLVVALIDVAGALASWCEKHPSVMSRIQTQRTERTRGQENHERVQERAQKRRDEKLAKEKEKKKNMTDEQLAKYEEKEYKKALKKKSRGSGGKMKVMRM